MEVNLTSAIRTTIASSHRIADFTERSIKRISTGQKHGSLFDNAQAVSVAKSLTNRASDFLSVKSTIQQGQRTVSAATHGLEFISHMLTQMKAVAQQYEATTSVPEQTRLSAQFTELQSQLDGLARDSSYGGTNLINASPDTLDVTLNEDGTTRLAVVGTDSTSAALGVTLTVSTIDAALMEVRGAAQTLGSNASVLAIREEFTDGLVNSLEEGAQKLVGADLNEEAANLLSAQTRGQLSAIATGLAAKSEAAIVQLF